MKKILLAVLFLGSAFAASAAETPASSASPTPGGAVVTSNRTVKVHAGCRPKRVGRRGGGVGIRHRRHVKQPSEAPSK